MTFGLIESLTFSVGLSRGWSDVYTFTLPGQEIEARGLPDGMYRLWSEADPEGWFREVSKDNNRSWVDFELSTRETDGARLPRVVTIGPQASDYWLANRNRSTRGQEAVRPPPPPPAAPSTPAPR